MKTTIKLGKELGYYSSSITNVFTTKDYFGELLSQYRNHLRSLILKEDLSNDFSQLYHFEKLLEDKSFNPRPCDNPLQDIEDARDALEHIIDNKKAYKVVFKILMKKCNHTNDAGSLIYNLLSVLRTSSKDFHETALKYDRYMGHTFSVANVILTVFAYGKLTGLVDFYNMEESKDG